ncbi:RagB/SusD family nutrient uptake outer membrane protein [Tamlana sp. I1]|uniref:RagB/SusD family nutrient uptake outer membrane protein n=1 Tax=Tamlana sp. I1 TaxID=2762061 RepID=UPI001E393341|nr:RagB/SusD family nutrient uptake outer membrane protein [Tamlana sp. I1]
MKTQIQYKIYLIAFLLSIVFVACEDYVTIAPPNSKVVSQVVFESDELATAAVNGIYHELFNFNGFASGSVNSITVVTGVSADELDLYNPIAYPEFEEYYEHNINPDSSTSLKFWSTAYNIIYMCNAALEGLNRSNKITEATKQQLVGEVHFIRAFAYFNLANLYGGVPLINTTDYSKNALEPRASKENTYQFIIEDLNKSKSMLSVSYRDNQRTHVNSYCATALLSRVYLYQEDWLNAEKMASEIINASQLFKLSDDLNKVFLANSEEAIWQISPVGTTGETREGNIFIITTPNYFLSPVALSEDLLNAFENGDDRLNQWVSSLGSGVEIDYFPFKYKIKSTIDPPSEYSTVLRLAEQYLIRAEARTNQGLIIEAQQDINAIRNRAGLSNVNTSLTADLLDIILKERRIELFSERGHRWFDLKRTGQANTVLSALKPNWNSTAELRYPIPESELAKNPNLSQNSEY